LFTNDEVERSRQQFLKFEDLFRGADKTDIDSDIINQAALLRQAFGIKP
jgi:hypothetical protein